MKKAKTKMSHKLAAAVTAGAMMTASSGAFATTLFGGTQAGVSQASAVDANTLINNISKSSTGLTNLLSLIGYMGGSGFSVAGIFKLKQHVDNPGNTPLKDGIMRLAAGGALLSLPFIISTMQGSVQEASTNTANINKVGTYQ